MSAQRLLALALAVALAAPVGCAHGDDGTSPATKTTELSPLSIRDDTADLMLTWIDDKGEGHVELHPADVPEAGRAAVRVVVADRDEGARDPVYVVDLTKKEADGSYAAKTMARRDWEALFEARREALLPKPAPPAQNAPGDPRAPGATTAGVSVIIYGASWCGPCHQAADYLKSKGIRYVMKDIDQDPGASGEMQQKLAKAGLGAGSIPVLDVQGQIIVGFNPTVVDRALAKAGKGTVL